MRLLGTVFAVMLAVPSVATSADINCEIGPVEKTYGGTKWLVYGCDDKTTLTIVAAPDNPATPFHFIFYLDGASYRLQGDGTGDKGPADAANKELSTFTDTDIAGLATQAMAAPKKTDEMPDQ